VGKRVPSSSGRDEQSVEWKRRAAEKIKYPEEKVVEQSKGKMTVLPSAAGRVKKWEMLAHHKNERTAGAEKGKIHNNLLVRVLPSGMKKGE
jgi:hypothetical protein